jgi:hypothetical protein
MKTFNYNIFFRDFKYAIFIVLLFSFFKLPNSFSQNSQSSTESILGKGAVIVVAVEGGAELMKISEREKRKALLGMVIAQGDTLEVEANSKITLLFSNGTLVTAQENTRMVVRAFDQQTFEPVGKKVADLQEEPSVSNVKINIDMGSLVVKTKKLARNSSFDINSPLGTAGIRGTEFQLGMDPSQGMQLDVTESTVAFTPPGGSPTPISQGQGLDISSTGAITARPVNPVVAQNVAVTNKAATQVSADVELETVTTAMNETTMEAGQSAGGDDANTEKESIENAESVSGDESESKEGVGGGSENESSSEGSSQSSPESSPLNGSDGKTEAINESNSAKSVSVDVQPVEPKIDEILENNQDAKQTRKTGKAVGGSASKLAKFNFDTEKLEKYYSYSQSVQSGMLDDSPEIVARLIELDGFSDERAIIFYAYSPSARKEILALDDVRLISLLDNNFDESIVLDLINSESVDNSDTSNVPVDNPTSSLSGQVLDLGDRLRESGKLYLFKTVEEMNSGIWTDEWISIVEVGDVLTSDYNLLEDWNRINSIAGADALTNPFFIEASTLYDQLVIDQFDSGPNPMIIGGRKIYFGSESYDFTQLMGDKSSILIAAGEKLSIDGRVTFTTSSEGNSRITAMSGGSIEIAQGTRLKSALASLVVSARDDILLDDVTFESSREVAIRSLRDLQLNQVTITAVDGVHLRASRNLDVDGLQLSQSLPSLIMEATTIRLSNIDFPSATAVQLNSLKGPIDGRYPNFGTGVSLEQQLGRVNFIENVRSGGNLMNDRPSFDQFGGNISIGKMINP